MLLTQTGLATLARTGIGGVFFLSMLLDLKAHDELFALMAKKNVRLPTLCFVGAVLWKLITSIGLITNTYAYWCALLLALYIFIANFIFNNFWRAPEKQRNFSFSMFLIYIAVCFGLLAVTANL